MKHKTKTSDLSSPYAKRHSLLLRWLPLILLGFIGVTPVLILTMIVSSFFRTPSLIGHEGFYLAHELHNSKPKTKRLNLSNYRVIVSWPVDNQIMFYGEQLHRGRKVSFIDRLYDRPVSDEIQAKIKTDMTTFGANQGLNEINKKLEVKTTVEVFYPEVRGIGWMRACAKVRLDMTASSNDSIVISKKYQSHYATSGLDPEYEGGIIPLFWVGADNALGITLRKTLDQFYKDLSEALAKNEAAHLKNVLFKIGSTDFAEGSEVDLDAVANLMRRNPKMVIELDGYTDNQGDLLKDKGLSYDRVKTVKSFLVHHGIKARRIKTKAFGATRPISTNHSEESRRLNRRVEFVIIKS